MKKLLLSVFAATIYILTIAQPQRLAALPSFLEIAGNGGSASSLCLDYFREGPGILESNNYGYYANPRNGGNGTIPGGGLAVDDYSTIPKTTIPGTRADELTYLSTENDLDGISKAKTTFLNERMKHYQRLGHFTSNSLNKFQDEVWAFDILEITGYIDSKSTAANTFTNGLTKFATDHLKPGVIATIIDVHNFGEELKYFQETSGKKILIFKSPGRANYLVYDRIGPSAYKGNNFRDMAATIEANYSTGDIVQYTSEGIASDIQETGIMLTLSRQLRINFQKDVLLTNDISTDFLEANRYKIDQPFEESSVRTITGNNTTTYEASLKLKNESYGENAVIEAKANRKNLIVTFLNRVYNYVSETTESYILSRQSKRIRNEVLATMTGSGASPGVLDFTIKTEGGSKIHGKIKNGKLKIIYASK